MICAMNSTVPDASDASGEMRIHQAIEVGETLTDVEVCGEHVFVGALGPDGKAGLGKLHVFKIDAATKKASLVQSMNTGALFSLRT